MLTLSESLSKRGKHCWYALRDILHSSPLKPAFARLDKNENATEQGMINGVRNSRVFLLYLTRGVFTRYYCQMELRTALAARKPVLLLWERHERGKIFRDVNGEVRSVAVPDLSEFLLEMPEVPGTSRREFEQVLKSCVAMTAEFHSDAHLREAMLDAICQPERFAYNVPC